MSTMCSSRRNLVWFLIVMVVVMAIIALVVLARTLDVAALVSQAERWKDSRPMEAAMVATALYVLWIVAFLPTTVPELVLGFMFGLAQGYTINVLGKLLGATICFSLGRTVLRECLLALLGGDHHELLLAFEEEVQSKPYTTALLLRAAFVPFSIKNYGLALMGLPAVPFFVALCVIDVPDSYICTAVGAAAKDLGEVLHQRDVDRADARKAYSQLAVVAVQLAVLLVLALHLHGLANRALARRRAACAMTCAAGAGGTRPSVQGRERSDWPYSAETTASRMLL